MIRSVGKAVALACLGGLLGCGGVTNHRGLPAMHVLGAADGEAFSALTGRYTQTPFRGAGSLSEGSVLVVDADGHTPESLRALREVGEVAAKGNWVILLDGEDAHRRSFAEAAGIAGAATGPMHALALRKDTDRVHTSVPLRRKEHRVRLTTRAADGTQSEPERVRTQVEPLDAGAIRRFAERMATPRGSRAPNLPPAGAPYFVKRIYEDETANMNGQQLGGLISYEFIVVRIYDIFDANRNQVWVHLWVNGSFNHGTLTTTTTELPGPLEDETIYRVFYGWWCVATNQQISLSRTTQLGQGLDSPDFGFFTQTQAANGSDPSQNAYGYSYSIFNQYLDSGGSLQNWTVGDQASTPLPGWEYVADTPPAGVDSSNTLQQVSPYAYDSGSPAGFNINDPNGVWLPGISTTSVPIGYTMAWTFDMPATTVNGLPDALVLTKRNLRIYQQGFGDSYFPPSGPLPIQFVTQAQVEAIDPRAAALFLNAFPF